MRFGISIDAEINDHVVAARALFFAQQLLRDYALPMERAFAVLLLLSCCAVGQSTSERNAFHTKQSAGGSQSCLPHGIKLDDVVTSGSKKTAVTVVRKLKQLGASCKSKSKLVAKNGKPIYFYKLTGCWGMAPQNYRAILTEQARKIADLEKKYEVVQMTCNPNGGEIK